MTGWKDRYWEDALEHLQDIIQKQEEDEDKETKEDD